MVEVNTCRKNRILLLTIILLSCLLVFIICIDKCGYHIDEIYSYILSNSYHADRISHDDSVWDQWISGDRLKNFVTVQEGEQFAYKKVYYNNPLDCHPPCLLLGFTYHMFTFSGYFQ